MICPPYCSRQLQHAVDERLATERLAARPSAARALHLSLGGDPGVVGAEDPLRAPPGACGPAHQASCTELLSAWPMCSAPVTFGGGIAIE